MKKEVEELLNKDKGFINNQNFKIEDCNEEFVKMSYEIKQEGMNPYDIVHGGVLFGLADTTSGVLAAIHNKKCVTTSATINYLSPAKKGKIYAVAKVLKEGKSIGYYIVDIYDEEDNLLVSANFNMYFINK